MYEELKKACEETKKMFGIEFSVDWRVDPKQDIQDNWQEGSANNEE